MQELWLNLMLLVVTFILAHGRTIQLRKDFSMTSLPVKEDAASQTIENDLSLDNIVTVRTPSSAVQDWSLVCQQLCGAALGGAVCAPYCKSLPQLPLMVQLENAEKFLDSKKDLICPELCGLQLGDDVCTCKDFNVNNVGAYKRNEDQSNVCAIICDHNNSVALTGCTPCKRDKRDKNSQNMVVKNFVETLWPKQVVSVGVKTSTTPNWNELCVSLCKTGDGGSLCNCDLSPFIL